MKRDAIAVRSSPKFNAIMDSAAKAGSPPESRVRNPTFSVTGRSELSRLAEDLENLERRVIENAVAVRLAELAAIDRKLDSELNALKAKERRC